MLDIKFIRNNSQDIIDGARKKNIEFDVDKLIDLDNRRLLLLKQVEDLRSDHNKVSTSISLDKNNLNEEVTKRLKSSKNLLREKEVELRELLLKWEDLMLRVPNIPDPSVPDGKSDHDNKEIKNWGIKPVFNFEPKNHIDIMKNLRMVDFDRGAKVHGFRGYYLTGDGVRLCFAIWNYALDFFSKKGFIPIIPPIITNYDSFRGTGYLPQGEDDLYKTQDSQYLAGTSEVPLMAFHSNEILNSKELPKKYLGFSPCYRREAGSHSKDVKGLIRVHEFYKFEQVILSQSSNKGSLDLHDLLNKNTEEFIESLLIPYRTVINCGGDLGLGQVKKYDIELWIPKEEKYREISSASCFFDFQTRRSNIRYKNEKGDIFYAHSLNATAIPTPRVLVSIIENFQQEDGSILVPEVLRSYLGKDNINL